MSIASAATTLTNAAVFLSGTHGGKGQKVDGDITKIFGNAKDMTQTIGGGFLMFIGAIGVLVGVYFLIANFLTSNPQNKKPWPVVGALIVIGGGLMFGASQLMFSVASTGKKTLDQLVEGTDGAKGGVALLADNAHLLSGVFF